MSAFRCYVLFSIFLFGYLRTEGKNLRLLCGSNLQLYDPVIEECINGHVFERTTTSAPNHLSTTQSSLLVQTESILVSEEKPSRMSRQTCRGKADLLTCNGQLYCGRNEGYRCCGFDVYHPKTQTCCRKTSAEFKIYDDKPEKKHMCCNLDVYERGSSNATCQHPADNDKFFQKPMRLRNDRRICHESYYVFRVYITKQKKGQYLTADVSLWNWRPASTRGKLRMKKTPTGRKEMDISLDKFSKKKNIVRKSFLIFSKYNYLKDSVLFLRTNEVLYKSPKSHRKMVRKLRNIHAKCTS
ncbi:uncharacterized protein LOC128556382 isoform X2 [Mercenaria mercenaria]|uniref:uncharacterized protein LOC128556382 isoform X2 n=1 Tax=Mercenaria mercenaria TaxID=6596 RepID=UPI00234E679A|nr:uncharacterized protein LOC128556382 isoform X2 [Mercenaria mercenaria]